MDSTIKQYVGTHEKISFIGAKLVVDQLKLNAKNKNTTKSTQKWLNVRGKWANERKYNPKLEEYEHEDLDKKLQMFGAEVRSKYWFFHNFAENIINKKSYDRSCISWCVVTRDVSKVLKLRTLKKHHSYPFITKCTRVHTISYI